MSKKLASFMAIAAAGLLSLPTLAQERVIEKVAQSGRTTIKSTPVLNAGSMLKANMLIQAIEKGEADKAEFEKIWNKNIPVANHAMRKSAKVDVLPYINDIASERNFYQLSVIDANNDSKTWIYNSYKTCASYTYHEKNNGDDWLITPGIKLEAGRGYDFSVDMAAGLGSYSERFEVKMVRAEDVPTAADLSAGTEVISTKVVSLEEFETYEKEGIWINETGYYYFGIHATTEANRYNLYAKNINVKVSSVTGDILAAPQIEVTPAAKGELKANIKVIAPQKRLDGSDFNTTMSKIEIYRDDILIKTFENVTKGQVLQFTDEKNIIARIHDYYAIPYDSDNKAGMKTDVISVYVGFDIPNLPTEMTATDMADKIGFRWNLVNTDIGIKGGYVDPAEIEYDLYTLAIKELWGYRYLELDENIGSVKNKDYYEYAGLQIDEGEQAFKNFGVRTRNVAGANTDFISCNMLVGKPYELPLIEGMKDKTFHTVWYNDGTVSELSVSKDATDGDGVALDFRMGSGAQPGMAFLSSGKLNLNASAHPALLFDAKRGSENSNLSIYGSKDGGKSEKIADVALKDEYTKFNVDLSSLKGSRYAQIRFVSNFASVNDNVIIDNIMIRDFYTDDLGIAMSAPESVMAGRKAVIEVTVENNGSNTCSNYTVDLYAGEKKIRTETVTEPLKMFEKKQLSFDFATTIFDEAGNVTLKAVVASENDFKAENNQAESMIAIKQSTVAVPTNLNATEGNGSVTLTWSIPEMSITEVTDDFESYGIWTCANIGQWTLVDGDKGITGSFFKEMNYPSQDTPFAYTVWAPKDYTGDGTVDVTSQISMRPHSGDKALASVYSFVIPEGSEKGEFIANDDWLISPELPGMAQTVSFHATHYKANDGSAQYPQTYQVLYSKTDKETASFTAIDGDRKTAGDWEKVSVELPEGSKYFAIRHISNKDDAFIFLVDDVTYSVGDGEIAGYNVYVDGELYTNVKGSELTAVVSGLVNGTHQFAVTAVYSNGAESRPVIVVLTTTGIDGISPDGKPVDIYTVDGQLVRKQATSLEGLKGLYVIGNRTVLVR